MERLLQVPGRTIYLVTAQSGEPAVYLIQDTDAGGILVNAPPYSEALADELRAIGEVKFLFLPSRFGARDLEQWRAALGLETMAYDVESRSIDGPIDIKVDNKTKLTRTIDFLPMSGRTEGSCALRLKNLPGVIFFGPILTPGESGWPTLIQNSDDHSFESRMFGVLGLQDVKYDYAFTDVFVSDQTQFGPGAGAAIQDELNKALEL